MRDITVEEAFGVLSSVVSSQRALSQLPEDARRKTDKVEREWLAAALERLTPHVDAIAPLLERAPRLPELAFARASLAASHQEAWVDQLEKLLAGLTFHAGSRDPIIEALFPNPKLAPLRKAKADAVASFQAGFEKRLNTGYVKRMLAQEPFSFVGPVLEALRAAGERWRAACSDEPMSDEASAALRAELVEKARAVRPSWRQAQLLAEAALVRAEGAYERLGLAKKVRKGPATAAPKVDAQAAPRRKSA